MSSIVGLSELPRERIERYLVRQGMSPEVVAWKYFDERFNRGRERGYAWVRQGAVDGFIGMIPFTVAREGERLDAVWSCDWSLADPSASPGMGIKLLMHLIRSHDLSFGLGGNENTRKLCPRLPTTRTVPDAGMTLHVPLRLGAFLERVENRLPLLRHHRRLGLHRVPLRVGRLRRGSLEVVTEPGVARSIAPLLSALRSPGWHPHYDYEYVDWKFGRCPVLLAWTCSAQGPNGTRAAAVLWRKRDSAERWRMALWALRDAQDHLAAVIDTAVDHVRRNQGMLVSILVSRLDTDLLRLLKRKGFIRYHGHEPLFISTPAADLQPVDELSSLSYLDTDLSHLF